MNSIKKALKKISRLNTQKNFKHLRINILIL
jgi:hypothetical protein